MLHTGRSSAGLAIAQPGGAWTPLLRASAVGAESYGEQRRSSVALPHAPAVFGRARGGALSDAALCRGPLAAAAVVGGPFPRGLLVASSGPSVFAGPICLCCDSWGPGPAGRAPRSSGTPSCGLSNHRPPIGVTRQPPPKPRSQCVQCLREPVNGQLRGRRQQLGNDAARGMNHGTGLHVALRLHDP